MSVELEPVLTVDVVPRGSQVGIVVGGAELPVRYGSRSEALRIAERLASVLQDGHAAWWEAFLEQEARLTPRDPGFGPTHMLAGAARVGSACCGAAMTVRRASEGTSYGVCSECGQPADAAPRNLLPPRAEMEAMPREELEAVLGIRGNRCVCGHLRSQHSGDRAEDFRCLTLHCGCNGWNPR